MRASTLIATLVLGGGILAGGTVFVPVLAQPNLGTVHASGATGRAPWLALHEVQLKLEAMGYRELTKISREGDQLRIQATDSQGRRVDIDVDSVTGDILDTEARRGKGHHTAEQASWLTMHQVQVKLEATGYRDIERIQRRRDRYEATATNAQGQRVNMAVAPRSGDVIEARAAARTNDAGGRSITMSHPR